MTATPPHLNGEEDGCGLLAVSEIGTVRTLAFGASRRPYQQDLNSAGSLTASANLLSSIKPGGKLSILVRQKPTWQDRTGGHLRSCFERHFQHFSLPCHSRFVGDNWTHWRTSQWFLGQHPRWGHLISTAVVPFETLTREQWQELALNEQSPVIPPCCGWIRRQVAPAPAMAKVPQEIPVMA